MNNRLNFIPSYLSQNLLRLGRTANINPISCYETNHPTIDSNQYNELHCQRYSTLSVRSTLKNVVPQSRNTKLLHPKLLLPLENVCFKSSKSKKKKKSQHEDSDSDDDDYHSNWELEKGKNFKDIKAMVPMIRMDAILKAGLGLSRSKVEESFYGNRIKVNNEKVNKKSQIIREGDIIDIRKDADTSDSGEYTRLVMRKIGDYQESNDRFPILVRKFPNLSAKECQDLDNS